MRDGHIQVGTETCDDGNAVTERCPYGERACRVCDATCQEVPGELEYCGDGVVNGQEECDDGNDVDTDACHECRNKCPDDDCLCLAPPGTTVSFSYAFPKEPVDPR